MYVCVPCGLSMDNRGVITGYPQESQFFPSTIWSLRIEHRLLSLAASPANCWVISPAPRPFHRWACLDLEQPHHTAWASTNSSTLEGPREGEQAFGKVETNLDESDISESQVREIPSKPPRAM